MEKQKFEKHILFGQVLPFSYDHFLENLYWPGPYQSHPSSPLWRQGRTGLFLLIYFRRAVLHSNTDHRV